MAALDADLQAAYAYTFPYYEMARTRYALVDLPTNPQRVAINTLNHRRALSDHKSRAVTTPNNDTLYSSAWLDLSAGPLLVTVPAMASRYWSFHFMDASTSTAALVGSRNAGQGAITLWVTREGDATPAPANARVLRLPTRDAWMLVRIVVDGPQDLAAVHALQDGIRLSAANPASTPQSPTAPSTPRGMPADGANYLAVVSSMLTRSGVPAAERAMVAGWARFGLGPGAAATPEQAQTLGAALPQLNADLRDGGGINAGSRQVQNWSYPNPAIGTFGNAYALRAGVALAGLGALPPEEAIYLSATTDSAGAALNGSGRYRVRIPAQGLAVGAFWSLSMYQVETDGRLFFTDNPIARYAISDRSTGLVKNADGSFDIIVQQAEPTDAAQKANWLPAPAGPLRLMLRAYLPAPELAQGRAPLPTVEKLP